MSANQNEMIDIQQGPRYLQFEYGSEEACLEAYKAAVSASETKIICTDISGTGSFSNPFSAGPKAVKPGDRIIKDGEKLLLERNEEDAIIELLLTEAGHRSENLREGGAYGLQ